MVFAPSPAASPAAAPEHKSAASKPVGNTLEDKIKRVRQNILSLREYNAQFIHPPINAKTFEQLTPEIKAKLHKENPIGDLVVTEDELQRLDKLHNALILKGVDHNRLRLEDENRLQKERHDQIIKEAKEALRCSCATITSYLPI